MIKVQRTEDKGNMTKRRNLTARMVSRRHVPFAAPVHRPGVVASALAVLIRPAAIADASAHRWLSPTRKATILSVVCLTLLGACSGGGSTQIAAGGEIDRAAADAADEATGRLDEAGALEAEASEDVAALSQEGAKVQGKKVAEGSGRLRPLEVPMETTLAIEAWVADPCVERGGQAILHVKAPSEAAIGYQAVYSDGRAGTDEPMGAGYGGNDKGMTPPTGEWISNWVVSLDAPPGPARVDVFVGYEGEWGYDDPHFAVADEQGRCPKRWLEDEDES